jgi:hypothetical protein
LTEKLSVLGENVIHDMEFQKVTLTKNCLNIDQYDGHKAQFIDHVYNYY